MRLFLASISKKFFKNCLLILFAILNIPLFKSIARFFVRNFKPKVDILVKVQGNKMYANTLDRIAALVFWKFSAIDDFQTRILESIIKKGMIVLDIGANLGYYTLKFAKLVGPEGRVFAFEPELNNYLLLHKNIEANHYCNVTDLQKAVSNKTGKINLFFCEEHRGNHAIFDYKNGRKVIEVEAIALDDLFSEKRVDVIKMDIQGAEYLALLGMEKLINRNKNLIIVSEFSSELLRKSGFAPEEVINKIMDLGFKLQFINEKNMSIEHIVPGKIIQIRNCEQGVNLYLEKK